MLSSDWTDVFPTRKIRLPPVCFSENFVNVISPGGFNAQSRGASLPSTRNLLSRETLQRPIQSLGFQMGKKNYEWQGATILIKS